MGYATPHFTPARMIERSNPMTMRSLSMLVLVMLIRTKRSSTNSLHGVRVRVMVRVQVRFKSGKHDFAYPANTMQATTCSIVFIAWTAAGLSLWEVTKGVGECSISSRVGLVGLCSAALPQSFTTWTVSSTAHQARGSAWRTPTLDTSKSQ